MANSLMARLSSRLYRSLLCGPRLVAGSPMSFSSSSSNLFSSDDEKDSGSHDGASALNSEPEEEVDELYSSPSPSPVESLQGESDGKRRLFDRQLENGLDAGIHKAILVGKVGQSPLQKARKNGTKWTLLMVGTGGIRNNRRPLENEDPKDYANRSSVLWHRVVIYPPGLGNLVMKNVQPG